MVRYSRQRGFAMTNPLAKQAIQSTSDPPHATKLAMSSIDESIAEQRRFMSRFLREPCALLSMRLAKCWGETGKVEQALAESLADLAYCNAIYAMDRKGIQAGATCVRVGDLPRPGDHLRDRSDRPYMKSALSGTDFVLSDVYISQNARRPSVTAVQAIRREDEILGFVGANFDLRELPLTGKLYKEPENWRQIKGDPAIRGGLFQQVRVDSLMDAHMDDILAIVEELIADRGVFHGKIHFSSSRATMWLTQDPFRYRILGFDDLVDPEICLAYPKVDYAEDAVVPASEIRSVLNMFKALRFADETIYLRSGSLNIFNGMVGLNFSCDGSHYMSYREFLDKSMEFWVGRAG